jgi:hypothetical protein
MVLRFEEQETTNGYFRCSYEYISKHGFPLSWYSDKDSVFTVNMPDKVSGLNRETQFSRAMKELKIEIILAHSPQAKGRVERANGTLQDRLVKELRLRNISNIEEANKYLPEFAKEYNKKFAKQPLSEVDSHRKWEEVSDMKLAEVLSIKHTRTLTKNLEFSYNSKIYQIQRRCSGYSFRYSKVDILEKMDGSIVVKRGNEYLNYKVIAKDLCAIKMADSKEINYMVDRIVEARAAA